MLGLMWIRILAAGITLLGFMGGLYWKGHSDASNACTLKVNQAVVQEKERQDEIRKDVQNMSDAELDAAYLHWVR
jgi:hypothetical protein